LIASSVDLQIDAALQLGVTW